MIRYDEIKTVEIEASSHCNAACPLCPRNVFGYPYNNGYTPTHLTLEQIKFIFEERFVKQLTDIVFEGNLGDPLMNPELTDIVAYFKTINSAITIKVFTNASLGTSKIWEKLASLKVTVVFAIDGLEDTHILYRRKTSWVKIIENAKLFISKGGNACWKMIRFDHNQHQIDACREMAYELGFKRFELVDHGRNAGPVFDNDGNLEYVLGNWQGETSLAKIMDTIQNGDILIEDISDKPKTDINCMAIENQSIYVSAIGEVYPCCFMGFNPTTFGHGTWHQPVNSQIKDLLKKNNALKYKLSECIEWFETIPSKWKLETFEKGKLIICNQHCGVCQKKN